MRVAMVGPTYPHRGGIVHYTHSLLDSLHALPMVELELHTFRKLFPHILYRKPAYEGPQSVPLPSDIPVHAHLVPYNPLTWSTAAAHLNGAETVHFQHWTPFTSASYSALAKAARRTSARTIATIHNIQPHDSAHRVLTPLARSFLQRMDGVVVHSEALITGCVKQLGIPRERVHVLPHGVYSAFDRGACTRDEARSTLGLGKEDVALLQFGTIRKYKGIDTAIRALALLPENHKLIVAGEAWEPWEKFEDLIDMHRVSHRVIRKIGYVPDDEVELYFRAADVAVFPYHSLEAQSGAASTALAFGVPIVVSRVGGLVSLPDHATFVKPGDAEELAQGIQHAASSGRKPHSAAEDMQWSAIAKRTMDLYRRVG